MKPDSGRCVRRAPTSRPFEVAVAAMLLGVLLLAGCAGRSVRDTVGGWVDRVSGKSEQRVAYTTVDRLRLQRDPDESSPVLAVLSLHEKVLRDRDEAGFAHVEVAGELSGWVPARHLVERLPRARKAEPGPSPEPEAPAPGAVAAPTEAATPVDSAEPASEPNPDAEEPGETTAPDSDVEPLDPERSIFDPY